MEEQIYQVISFDGDYAQIKRIDPPSEEGILTPVARALLPDEITEGNLLKRVLFDYELIE